MLWSIRYQAPNNVRFPNEIFNQKPWIPAIYRRDIKFLNEFDILCVSHSDKATLFSLDRNKRNQYIVV
jgi:hypothetical protein